MKKFILLMMLCFGFVGNVYANTVINILTDRSDNHLKVLVAQYEKETGHTVNLTFIKKGLVEKSRSGNYDIVITKNSSELISASQKGLLKRLPSRVFVSVPEGFKDDDRKWFLMSYRIRVFHIRNTTTDWPRTYEDLEKPQYKGRICIRKLTHNYNLELFGTMLRDMGPQRFTAWFKGFKANLTRQPYGNDRNQVKGVFEGECDIAIANSYYRGLMESNPAQKSWADNTILYIPDQGPNDHGAIALFAGVGMMSNKDINSIFLSYLIRDDVQKGLSVNNFEYPQRSRNTSPSVHRYGETQGLNCTTLKIHPNIQNGLFEYRKRAYLIIKSN